MFDNPGRKIQDIARVLFWLEIIGGVILGVVFGIATGDAVGFLVFFGILIATSVTAYITYLFLIAFGELVENSTIMANDVLKRKNADKADAEPAEEEIREELATTSETAEKYKQISDMNVSNQEKLYQFAIARIEAGEKFDLENAVRNLETIPGYKDADELLQQCKESLKDKA